MKDHSADEYQQKAITSPSGSACILAGPGSGKTFILIHRIKYLIETLKIPPKHILVITFTRKAAAEMRQRFMALKIPGGESVNFGTFHSVYYQFIKTFSKGPVPQILSAFEKAHIVNKILDSSKNMYDPSVYQFDDAENILSALSLYKNKGSLDNIPYPQNSFLKLIEEYESAKNAVNKIDYDDILFICKRMFESDDTILKKARDYFDAVLIDEFQDINPIQADVLRLIKKETTSLYIVGDDDQSIYGFRGASYSIMSDFIKEYDMSVTALKNNYRNPVSVIDASDAVIVHNTGRLKDYKLNSAYDKDGLMSFEVFNDKSDEISRIRELIAGEPDKNDICILVRTNKDLAGYERIFSNGPARIAENIRNIINADISAYIGFTLYGKRKYILRMIRSPESYIPQVLFDTEDVDLKKIYREVKSPVHKNSLNILINHLKTLENLKPFGYLNYVLNIVGYKKYIQSRFPQKDSEEIRKYLDDLLKTSQKTDSIKDFFDILKKDTDVKAVVKPIVNIMTFHASKGLEFKTVIIPDVNEGKIPARSFMAEDDDEEERRLFYVAMTRALENLYVFSVKKEGSSSLLPSRFISEFL